MASNDRKNEVLDGLTAGIARLTDSAEWRSWLDAARRFHKYSFNNILLIQSQRNGEATRVAGFNTWRSLGRSVRKGEKAIWILAPIKRKAGNDDDTPDEQRENVRVITGFRPAAVFDIAQTDGDDLPEICRRLDGDDPNGAYEHLATVASGLGYRVEVSDFPGTANGDCTFAQRRIRVRDGLAPAQKVKTLAHEIAHAMLHDGICDGGRAVAELEAESVAYIVSQGVDVDSESYTFGYVASWAGGGDEAIAAIKASGTRIQRTAADILERLEAAANGGLSTAA
jgi:N-terminal domain of anti-restriction factor ArdC/IrrE N-terminal-like domain